jgi:hypothetical protein
MAADIARLREEKEKLEAALSAVTQEKEVLQSKVHTIHYQLLTAFKLTTTDPVYIPEEERVGLFENGSGWVKPESPTSGEDDDSAQEPEDSVHRRIQWLA